MIHTLAVAFALLTAHAQPVPGIKITQAWTLASPEYITSRPVYMTIENTGPADELVSASSPFAEHARLQLTHINKLGITNFEPVKSIPLPAHQKTALEPGKLHILLMDITTPFQQGMEVPVRLVFKNAPAQNIRVLIGSPTDTTYPGRTR